MEKKINIAELLKYCPKGMVLDCTMLDNVVFEKIDTGSPFHPIIIRRTDTNKTIHLTKYGQYSIDEDYKCVIFPKGKTTWEGFVPPCRFKDGDIITTLVKNCGVFYSIYKNIEDKKIMTYVDCYPNGDRIYNNGVLCFANEIIEQRLVTEEEKQKLFDAIKANGYKWNEETKTLEEVEQKFKVGDRIWLKENHNYIYTITGIRKKENKYECGVTFVLRFSEQDNWELVPNKFDFTTLKPFDKVLVRDIDSEMWKPDFFGHLCDNEYSPFMVVGGIRWKQCIPYEGNQHLLGTTDDCDNYYKI